VLTAAAGAAPAQAAALDAPGWPPAIVAPTAVMVVGHAAHATAAVPADIPAAATVLVGAQDVGEPAAAVVPVAARVHALASAAVYGMAGCLVGE